jgi:hypothetical protein
VKQTPPPPKPPMKQPPPHPAPPNPLPHRSSSVPEILIMHGSPTPEPRMPMCCSACYCCLKCLNPF